MLRQPVESPKRTMPDIVGLTPTIQQGKGESGHDREARAALPNPSRRIRTSNSRGGRT